MVFFTGVLIYRNSSVVTSASGVISCLLSHIYGNNYSNIVVKKISNTQLPLLYCYYDAHTKSRFKDSKITNLLSPFYCLGALVRHFVTSTLFQSPQLLCPAKVLQIAHIYVLLFVQALCKITRIQFEFF